ncbi:hypothetical protein [Porcipelethomonas sp.]|uniref:hypothetical protein n=1 Tax=Porcipelethomonas sp. TaxID=2981675 RepID=UPI003EF5BB55
MNVSTINSLFTLFSGETDTSKYEPLVSSAVTHVRNMLREDASSNDIRLDYLCAAIAGFRYTQITCVRNKVAYTYAGTASKEGNSQLEYDFSRELMLEYYKSCADLLNDDNFMFSAVGCCYESGDENES